MEEALDMAAEAITLCLESAKEHNEETSPEVQGTLVAVLDAESGKYWTKAIESCEEFEKSFGDDSTERSREEIYAQAKVTAGALNS